jgi:hypothetical protein
MSEEDKKVVDEVKETDTYLGETDDLQDDESWLDEIDLETKEETKI